MEVVRLFTLEELGFFAVPRTWKAIELRFDCRTQKDENPFRDAFITADDDGGSGHLHWLKDKKAWVLTDKGKSLVGKELMRRGAAWEPPKKRRDARRDPPLDIFGDDEPAVAPAYEVIPCPACASVTGCPCQQESPDAELARLQTEQAADEGAS